MTNLNPNQVKVFYAIAQLLNSGERNLTRYKVAKAVPSLNRTTVDRILKRYEEGYKNGFY